MHDMNEKEFLQDLKEITGLFSDGTICVAIFRNSEDTELYETLGPIN